MGGHIQIILFSIIAATSQVNDQRISITLKGIDASIASAQGELFFVAKFTLNSAWVDALSTKVSDDCFLTQDDPELERAHGDLVIGKSCGRYKFTIDSPFHLVNSFSSFASNEYAWRDGVWLHYCPSAVSVEGPSVKEMLQVSAGGVPFKVFHSSDFCPYWNMGFIFKGLFVEIQKNRQFEFFESCEKYLGAADFQGDCLRVSAKMSNPQPYTIDWFFDNTRAYPTLLEIRQPNRVTTFDKYQDLFCGVRFPMESTTVRGPYVFDGKRKFHVTRWTFFDFEERVPARGDFDINFVDRKNVYGYDVEKGSKKLNVVDLDIAKIVSSTPEKTTFSHSDEEFNEKHSLPPSEAKVFMNNLFSIGCWICVIVFGIAFLRTFKK